jgi:hypothetical protein
MAIKKSRYTSVERIVLIISIVFGVFVIVGVFTPRPDERWKYIRASVDRSYADMRSLEYGINQYYKEHGTYPAMRPLKDFTQNPELLERMNGGNLCTIEPGGRSGMCGITTPIAYLTGTAGFSFHPDSTMTLILIRLKIIHRQSHNQAPLSLHDLILLPMVQKAMVI